MSDEMTKWYVVNEITGEEFGPYKTFDEAHDSADIPANHTFKTEERWRTISIGELDAHGLCAECGAQYGPGTYWCPECADEAHQ